MSICSLTLQHFFFQFNSSLFEFCILRLQDANCWGAGPNASDRPVTARQHRLVTPKGRITHLTSEQLLLFGFARQLSRSSGWSLDPEMRPLVWQNLFMAASSRVGRHRQLLQSGHDHFCHMRGVSLVLVQCWTSVLDADPALSQR